LLGHRPRRQLDDIDQIGRHPIGNRRHELASKGADLGRGRVREVPPGLVVGDPPERSPSERHRRRLAKGGNHPRQGVQRVRWSTAPADGPLVGIKSIHYRLAIDVPAAVVGVRVDARAAP
jgi:hypothetical protein